jgi:hypothetical protein
MSQPAAGKVMMHFAVSVDGFVAGPGHDMSFMEKTTVLRRRVAGADLRAHPPARQRHPGPNC